MGNPDRMEMSAVDLEFACALYRKETKKQMRKY